MVSQNSFYPKWQLFVKMPKVQSCKLYMMHCTRENSESLSLNGCLKTGPALGPARGILIRKNYKPIVLCGNLQKAFPQIQIKKGSSVSEKKISIKKKFPDLQDMCVT